MRLLRTTVAGFTVTPVVTFAPEYVALIVTGVDAVTVPAAVKENVAVDWPAKTVTLEGIVAPAGDELSVTVAALKAADESVTLQVVPADGDTDVALHVRLLRLGVCSIVTVPLVVDIGIDTPWASAAELPVSWMVEDGSEAFPARVSVTVAKTAFGIVLSFIPQATHVALPEDVLQLTVLPVAPGPAATVADEKSVGEYPNVHSADAGRLPVAFSVRLRATVLPGAPAPDERLSEVWAQQERQAAKATIDMRIIRDRSAC